MRISERRLILAGLDLAALISALVLALTLRSDYQFGTELITRNIFWYVSLAAIWFLLADAFDAYDLQVSGKLSLVIPALLKTVLLTTLMHLLMPILSPPWPASWGAFFVFPLLALALVTVGRGLYLLVLDQPVFQRRVLIVGAGWAGRTIAEVLEKNGNGTYELVGFVDDDPEKLGKAVRGRQGEGEMERVGDAPPHPLTPSPKVLGDRTALSNLIARHQINTLVVAITDEVDGELLQTLTDCLEHGVNILPMPVLYEQLTGRVPVHHVGENWYVAMPLHHPGTGALWPLVNRLFDLVSAGLGALCLGLALPFIALAIYLDSPGPIFYTQERVGKGGKRFRVYKFRSMIPEAEKGGKAVWAKENDDRVTRVGRILRKMHVDEFPQFFNILKGEMSAVGPRPERPEFVQELAEEIPFYRVRHAVKPGMAGWGLVKQGYGSSKEDAMLKLQYDLYYIKHQSLWVDTVILLKTVADTLTFGGRA
jgi:exopolysaccharide biosynthesis polyprenyl glycosylphosphotransferase